MNVLYSFRTRGVGAEAVHISGVVLALERLGHKVFFHSACSVDAGSNPFRGEGARSSVLSILCRILPRLVFELMEIAYNAVSWLQTKRLLRKHDFGFVYERHANFHFSTGVLARKYKVPLVVEVNELAGDERVRGRVLLSSMARRCDRKLFECANLIVVVSPYLKREIIRRYGVPEEKIDVQCNGVDKCFLGEGVPCRDDVLRRVNGASCVFGFVGWFVHWHRLDMLLEVFSRMCHKCPDIDVRLLLVGDGPLKKHLEEDCLRLAISEKVIFAGAVQHVSVPGILRAVDVAVIPHSNEYRSPVKLFEYMAGECAVIAPQTEPISSVIEHGENGLLFSPMNKGQMLDMFIKFASDKELRSVVAVRARMDVIENYTWKHNVLELLKRLEEDS